MCSGRRGRRRRRGRGGKNRVGEGEMYSVSWVNRCNQKAKTMLTNLGLQNVLNVSFACIWPWFGSEYRSVVFLC